MLTKASVKSAACFALRGMSMVGETREEEDSILKIEDVERNESYSGPNIKNNYSLKKGGNIAVE